MRPGISPPAARPIPIAWTERIAGNANTDVDSRTQVLRAVASSHRKNAFKAGGASGLAGPRGDDVMRSRDR